MTVYIFYPHPDGGKDQTFRGLATFRGHGELPKNFHTSTKIYTCYKDDVSGVGCVELLWASKQKSTSLMPTTIDGVILVSLCGKILYGNLYGNLIQSRSLTAMVSELLCVFWQNVNPSKETNPSASDQDSVAEPL